MDLRRGTTFQFQQCPQHLQRQVRELASFPLALIGMSLATIAKNPDMSKMTAENSKERRINAAMTGRIPRKNIQNIQLATERTTRRNDVGKALEPTSSPKTLNWRTPQLSIRPPAKTMQKKQTTSILKNPKKLDLPRLQVNEKLRVRQYIISDPSNVYDTECYTTLEETSSADWQQQIKTPPNFSTTLDPMSDRLQNYTSTKRPIPLINDYNPYYPDRDFGLDPYWEAICYNQHHLYFYNNYNSPDLDVETDFPETGQTLNTVLVKARVDPWQHGAQFTHHTAHSEADNEFHRGGRQVSLATAVTARFVNTLVTRTGEPDIVPLTNNLALKYKRRMLFFPMDFAELTLDGLVDTGASSSAIPEADLRKIRLLAPQSIVKEGPAPNFQIMVANVQLETPKSTVELKFEVSDIEFHEIFIVMEKLTSPLIGLSFLQQNNTILDMGQSVLNFPFFSMQLKTADHKYTNVMEPICIREDVTFTPNDRHSVQLASQLYEDTTVTGILQPSNTLADEGDIAFCAALVTLTNGQVSVYLNNFTDSSYTLKRGMQVATFTVLTPEQMNYVNP